MTASILAPKVTSFFKLAAEQLSLQKHYDFGLRAIKVQLTACDLRNVSYWITFNISSCRVPQACLLDAGRVLGADFASEEQVLVRAIFENTTPKLVGTDLPQMMDLLRDFFLEPQLPDSAASVCTCFFDL